MRSFRSRPFSKTVTAGTELVIATIEVPSHGHLSLFRIGNYVDDTTAWGHVTWRVRRNGIPVSPIDEIKDEIGWGALPGDVEAVDFKGGDVLDVLGVNDHTGDVKMGIRLGYNWG